MDKTYLAWGLIVIGVAIILLTHVRLGRNTSGRFQTGKSVLWAHTIIGLLSAPVWVAFLLMPHDNSRRDMIGLVGLALSWTMTLLGLLLLVRWLPSKGRHAGAATHDSWSDGPGLSLLAHLGMLFGVILLTWLYLSNQI